MSFEMKDALESIFGKENVSLEEVDCIAYSMDSSQTEGRAVAITWPTKKEQIAELIKESVKKEWNIVSRGGGSGLVGGCVPQDSIILDMSKMDCIGTPDKSQKTVVVESGVILDDLNNTLEEHGLFFPVNPSSHTLCSIGGMVATNASGNNAVRYGKTSDWVECIKVVNGKGEMLELKGNDAKEFAGTEGILGVVTSLKLRLTEPVSKRSLSMIKYSNYSDMIKKVDNIRDNKTILSVEFFDRLTARLSGLEDSYYLFIEFGSNDGVIKDGKEIQRLWTMREDACASLFSKGYLLMEDPVVPLDGLEELMGWLNKNSIPHFGHIATGIIHQTFKPEQKNLLPEMFKMVQKLGGTVSGEHGIGLLKKEYLDKGTADKLRGLKKRYDPFNILNRGKVL